MTAEPTQRADGRAGEQHRLRYRDRDGALRVVEAGSAVVVTLRGSRLQCRDLVLSDGSSVLVKAVPAGAPADLIGRLEAEVGALTRIHRTLAVAAPEMPELVGYDLAAAEPFALLQPYRGCPVSEVVGRLSRQDRWSLFGSLLRALRQVHAAGLVHGGVDPTTVRWDGAVVQLVNFEEARPRGWPRSAAGHHPYRSPEQRLGSGAAHPADDLWGAALTMAEIVRGRPPDERLLQAGDMPEELRPVIDGVLTNLPEARPHPDLMLARMGVSAAPLTVVDPDQELAAGRQWYDEVVAGKRRGAARLWPQRSRWSLGDATAAWNSAANTASDVVARLVPADRRPVTVRCPICMDSIVWQPDAEVTDETDTGADPAGQDPSKAGERRRFGYVRCPNPSDDMPEHVIPADYGAFRRPLVIGLVGGPGSGKTHLLTAMVREAHRSGMLRYGLGTSALDVREHHRFRRERIVPFERGTALPGTRDGTASYADTLLLRRADGAAWPVVLFDVAGEDLRAIPDGRTARFLLGADGLIFVHGLQDTPVGEPSENRAFAVAIERALADPARRAMPVAIALTKADRLRFVHPVGRWIDSPTTDLDPEQLRAEAADLAAYLHRVGAGAALIPLGAFTRCTLHAVSATGGDAVPADGEEVFARGAVSSRVLDPLVSVLAMLGVIRGRNAAAVGRP